MKRKTKLEEFFLKRLKRLLNEKSVVVRDTCPCWGYISWRPQKMRYSHTIKKLLKPHICEFCRKTVDLPNYELRCPCSVLGTKEATQRGKKYIAEYEKTFKITL